MAGAERIAASAITATAARPAPSPMRNFRPAFEDIMLTAGPQSMDRPAVPQKLAVALCSLMESAREKGVEAQVDSILRAYASEIKNDIVLLTISRLRDLVQSLPQERLGPRLAEITPLMREFPQAADTVPEIVLNAERLQGGERLGPEQMRRMLRSVVGRSKSLCPKELFSVMKTDYESGRFDAIAGVAEARSGAAPASAEAPQKSAMAESAPLAVPEMHSGTAPSSDMPRLAGPQDGKEVPDSLHARPEMVWCDEVRPRRRKDEAGPVFEGAAGVMRWDRVKEAVTRKRDMPAEPAVHGRRTAAPPESRLPRTISPAARSAEAEHPSPEAQKPEAPREGGGRAPQARPKQAEHGKGAPAPGHGVLKAEEKTGENRRATGPSTRAARRNAVMIAARIPWMSRITAARTAARIKRDERTKNPLRREQEKVSGKPKRTGAGEANARMASPREKGRSARAKKAREAPGAGKALMQRQRTGRVRAGAAGRRPATGAENAKAAEKRRSAGRRKRPQDALAKEARAAPRRRSAAGSRMKPSAGRRKEPLAARKRKGGAAARMALLGLWRSARPWRKGRVAPAGLRWPAARG